jgi:DNA repair protein RadC
MIQRGPISINKGIGPLYFPRLEHRFSASVFYFRLFKLFLSEFLKHLSNRKTISDFFFGQGPKALLPLRFVSLESNLFPPGGSRMYSPKIDETLIPALYRWAKEKKIPMTRLVSGILRCALKTAYGDPANPACRENGIIMDCSESAESRQDPCSKREKAISIVRIQMVREGRFPGHPGPVRNSSDAAEIFRSYLAGADREYFVVLLLDQKHRINALNLVSVGSLTTTLTHPREVFKPALLANAARVILCHNHPSGDPAPSREDIELTRRLVAAGEIFGIEILDHVVIGDGSHASLADQGLILPRGQRPSLPLQSERGGWFASSR